MEQKRIEEIYSVCKVTRAIDRMASRLEDAAEATYLYSATAIIEGCKAEIERLQKERNAAIADLGTNCYGCTDWELHGAKCPNSLHGRDKNGEILMRCQNYKWRGLED